MYDIVDEHNKTVEVCTSLREAWAAAIPSGYSIWKGTTVIYSTDERLAALLACDTRGDRG